MSASTVPAPRLSALPMGRKQTFAAMTATAPVAAEPYIPYPASVPIAAEHHNVASVFRPVMFSPYRGRTPMAAAHGRPSDQRLKRLPNHFLVTPKNKSPQMTHR